MGRERLIRIILEDPIHSFEGTFLPGCWWHFLGLGLGLGNGTKGSSFHWCHAIATRKGMPLTYEASRLTTSIRREDKDMI